MTGRRAARIIALPALVAAGALALGLAGAPAARAAVWTAETSPVTTPVYGVTCPDASDCWAVGGSSGAAKIIHTSNGAATSPTWSAQTPPSGAFSQYNDIDCENASDCIAVGSVYALAPLISATTDGGATWTAQMPPGPVTVALQGISCASSADCVAVGGVLGTFPTIISTTNGGSTWTSETSPSTTHTQLNDVACPSATVCYAVGGNSGTATIIGTTNGGATWTAQTTPATDDVALNGITCPTTTVCFAVGNAITGTGEIVATTNGGATWTYQSDGTSQALNDVSCWDTTDCVAVGASGTIVGTSNGTGWSSQTSGTSDALYDVDVSPQTSGKVVGASGTILGYTGCASGGLSFTPPAAVSWPSTALNGRNQSITTPLTLAPNDQTGSGAGWNLSATSTTFTSSGHTLPTAATQITAASASSAGGTCSLPVNQISYPVTIPAAATSPAAVKVFDAAAGTGAGPATVVLTTSLSLPANARVGTYSSTWTLTLASGP
ncbi:MAG: WxL domain-containing protein [Solirubrobacterales bacterium]|nr:WxL domain-containing protein [Solirubrobacterales bacterium]